MKTTAARPRFLRVLKLAGGAWWGALALAAGAVAAETTPDKSFVLFMGADVDVQLNQKEYRVKNVEGYSFVINVDGKPVEVATNRGSVAMKVVPSLKLSDKAARVEGLKFERAYTPENDPVQKWRAAQSAGSGAASASIAAAKWATAAQGVQQAHARGVPDESAAQAAAAAAERTYQNAERMARNDIDNAGRAAGEMQAELDKKLFDAVRVNCDISSPQPMRDPYVVIVTQYREKDDPPGAVKNWIYAFQLDRLDETPLKVKILKGGFPPGFELLKQQFHVYGAGRELGTNVAEKNVSLTRDEAHEYIVIDHLTTHKGATVAPAVALGVSHKDFFPHFASVQLEQEIFVKVDKRGRPAGVFRNEKCTEAAGDAYLESLVAQARFKPALQAGKAVDSVAKLKIADLAI